MTSLRDMQRAFLDALYDEDLDEKSLSRTAPWLKAPPNDTLRARFEVYRRNLIFGLLRTLQSRFPMIQDLLSEQNFRFFSKRYIFACPMAGSPDTYGESFPTFLSEQPELSSLAFLEDLGRLEWHTCRPRVDPVHVTTEHHVFAAWARWRDHGLDGVREDDFMPGEEKLRVMARDGEAVVRSL